MTLMSEELASNEVHVTTYLVENKGHFATYLFGGDAEQQASVFETVAVGLPPANAHSSELKNLGAQSIQEIT